jgi:hypothetical protein
VGRYELIMCPNGDRVGLPVLESDDLGETVIEALEQLEQFQCEWEIRDHDQGDRVVAEGPARGAPGFSPSPA